MPGRQRGVMRLLVGVAALLPVSLAAAPAQAGLLGTLTGTVTGVVGGTVGTVVGVVGDVTGLLGGADWGYTSGQTSMADVAQAIGADRLRSYGYTGRGVGVALIDTGVVPVPGLTSGNVVNGPDLSFDGQDPVQRDLDGFGHGTHLAGIIAGNDRTNGFYGVAPGATLLSVRVGAHDGAADVSQVVAAVDWVVQHRADPGLNIRVLNLSFGTDGTQSAQLDPLDHAVENAWRHGIVVVVSAGNRGASASSLDNPAYDPYVIAVGADDTQGTSSYLDDAVPDFSSRGSLMRHPDVVAPGQSIVSLRDPGGYVDEEFPGARVDSAYFKGSGTSQAAAVVSGAAALLLQQRPSLTPDDVKQLLVSTAHPLPQADALGQGAGLVNVYGAAVAPRPYAHQTWPASSGMGSLEAARGSHHVSDDGVDLTGEQDIFGTPWQPAVWAPASALGSAWSGGTWNGDVWAGDDWSGSSWAPVTYASADWTSRSWSGVDWSSRSWSSRSWSSRSWSGDDWSSRSWSSRSWSGAFWSAARGDG